MTDRQRIERTYAKIKKKYPHIDNKEEIDDLAIRYEKKFSWLCCLGLLAGAALCFLLGFLINSEDYSSTRYLLIVTGGYQIFEIFRALSKYSKIEKMYRPVETVSYHGILTPERILKDGKKVLKKSDSRFTIVKLPLFDKEDETEVGVDNMTYHVHSLYFQLDAYGSKASVKTDRSTYMDAAIGAMYYVVLSGQNEIAAAYQASNWQLDPSLLSLCTETARQETMQEQPTQQNYQPAPLAQSNEPEKTKRLLPILAMVLIVVSYFTIILLGVPIAIAALVLAIVALTQQRSKLSIASMIVTAVLFLLLMASVLYMYMG